MHCCKNTWQSFRKSTKSRYLKNRLTDFDENWSADAPWPSKPYETEKIKILKSKTTERHGFENENRHLPFLNFQKM